MNCHESWLLSTVCFGLGDSCSPVFRLTCSFLLQRPVCYWSHPVRFLFPILCFLVLGFSFGPFLEFLSPLNFFISSPIASIFFYRFLTFFVIVILKLSCTKSSIWVVCGAFYWVWQKYNCCRERLLFVQQYWAFGNRTEEEAMVLHCLCPNVLCHSPFTLSPVTAHTQVSVNWVWGIAFMTAALSCKQKEKNKLVKYCLPK